MKALYYEKPLRENASIREMPDPVCGSHDIVIKVMSCSICHGVEADHEAPGGSSCSGYPLIPGHEFAGYVHEVGDAVTTFRVGDRVTADNTVPCGVCHYCKKGDFIHCPDKRNLGNKADGGFAEYVKVAEGKAVRLPDHVSFNEGCLSEPVACCMHSMDQMNIRYGDDVLVMGAGPMGMILAMLASHSNANHVVVCASSAAKLEKVKALGIETVLMDRGDYSKHEKELLSRYPLGFDCLFDATGAEELVYSTPRLMKMGGRILGYGYYRGERPTLRFPFSEFWDRELTYYSSLSQVGDFGRAVGAIAAGKVNAKALISGEYDLDHYFDGLDRVMHEKDVIKIIIHPNAG
ncbi:alcohol dehydrogenase catalytic domain-containing protein [Anaerotruncus massiliensis (ex Togo et al. 2019)]|uniref:alcohol dehydrogenase catalytic domain-containing protein n=1 Tax=Anaerotruncus TaxID=244127 RepID=UPI000C76BD40|nr:alcohol dehydrogenase catalytic domain-containing protein [Anaerotruncus massiliensis (ex Togo et al. 2019)]